MLHYLPYIQVALSVLLMAGVLLQRSDASIGAAFGTDSVGGTHFARRGAEKVLFHATIVISILFGVSVFASLVLSR